MILQDGGLVGVAVAIALAFVHLFAGRLRSLRGIPRSRWLSFAGGVSVAYVFVHLLPELAEAQEHLSDVRSIAWLDQHAYLLALAGLVIFYAVEALLRRAKPRGATKPGEMTASDGSFWISTASFATYNATIGYIVTDPQGAISITTFAIAMALHFVVNDYGLQEHHEKLYERVGRYILAGAVVLGSLAGLVFKLDEAIVLIVIAFLAGGIVLNVLKEELPKERESRLLPFVTGAAAYAALLLAL